LFRQTNPKGLFIERAGYCSPLKRIKEFEAADTFTQKASKGRTDGSFVGPVCSRNTAKCKEDGVKGMGDGGFLEMPSNATYCQYSQSLEYIYI
jgi:hypothetical protein